MGCGGRSGRFLRGARVPGAEHAAVGDVAAAVEDRKDLSEGGENEGPLTEEFGRRFEG